MSAYGFRIAAFNVQRFGDKKANDEKILGHVAEIIRRYEIILIQEIVDKDGDAIEQLLEEVNKRGRKQYMMKTSGRLGSTRYKEQYAYFYREDSGVEFLETYQYPDHRDEFEREPFAVLLESTRTSIDKYILVACHIDPDKAFEEISALVDVHKAVKEKWGTDNVLILGDLNAEGSYLSKTKSKRIQEEMGPEYHWLLDEEADTTVAKGTDAAYDRFIMTGNDFLESYKEGSAQVFRFDKEFELSQEEAEDVSDHYPIELQLKFTRKRKH